MEFNLAEVALRIILLLIIALSLTIGTVVVLKLFKIDLKDFKQRTGPRFMSIALVANLLFIYSVYLLLKLLDGKDIQTLGFSMTLTEVRFSLLTLLLTLVIAFSFVYVLSRIKNYQVQWALRDFIRKGEISTFFLSCMVLFVAALQEEVMFRGYLAFVFQNYSIFAAMLLSTVIFTVWHFIGNKVNIYQVIDWFIGGLLLFFVYFESGCIWVAAIVYFSRNLTNILVFNIADKHSLLQWRNHLIPKYKTQYIILCSGGIALLSYIVF